MLWIYIYYGNNFEYVTSEIMFLKECGFGIKLSPSQIIFSEGNQVLFLEATLWSSPCGEELSSPPSS